MTEKQKMLIAIAAVIAISGAIALGFANTYTSNSTLVKQAEVCVQQKMNLPYLQRETALRQGFDPQDTRYAHYFTLDEVHRMMHRELEHGLETLQQRFQRADATAKFMAIACPNL